MKTSPSTQLTTPTFNTSPATGTNTNQPAVAVGFFARLRAMFGASAALRESVKNVTVAEYEDFLEYHNPMLGVLNYSPAPEQ